MNDDRRYALDLPPQIPRRRCPLLGPLARWLLRLGGWRLELSALQTPRAVVIAAPHTSNWDGIWGLAAVCAAEVDLRFFAKHTLFRGPLGWLLRMLGGMPVNRSAAHGTVDAAVRAFADERPLLLALAPEGTRRRVARWKTGWLRIARAASVPVVAACLDYGRREIRVADAFAADAPDAELWQRVRRIYRDVTPCRPANFALPVDS